MYGLLLSRSDYQPGSKAPFCRAFRFFCLELDPMPGARQVASAIVRVAPLGWAGPRACGGSMAGEDLEKAVEEFYSALNQVLSGSVEPMLSLWSHADDVTYMNPLGGLLVDWPAVEESWRDQAASIRGEVRPEEL